MNNCSIELPKLPEVSIIESLKDIYKNDYVRLISNIEYILNNNKDRFNEDFIKYYKEKYNLKSNPIFATANAAVVKKLTTAAVDYINEKDPRISNKSITNNDQSIAASYNYSEPAARDEGKRFVSEIILDAFKQVKFDNINITGNKLNHYLTKARAKWLTYIFSDASEKTKKPIENIIKEYNEATNKRDFINNILGGTSKTEVAQNLYAVWCELNIDKNHAIDYITDLFNDSLLNKVLDDVSRSLDEINDENNAESNPELNELSDTDIEGALIDVDSTFANYDHSGVKNNFTKHASDIIRIYFDTLPVLNSTKLDDYDTNNHFGIPAKMSAKECIQFMYSINEQFNDIESMIEAIKMASKNIKRFHSFAKFVQDLEQDKNFSSEIFTTFAKPKYEMTEVTVNENKTITDISNQRVSKKASLTFDFMNNIKSSITTEPILLKSIYNDIRNNIDSIFKHYNNSINKTFSSEKRNDEKIKLDLAKKQVITNITKILKLYFPSIEPDSIRAYLELNNDAFSDVNKFRTNCINIASDIKLLTENHQDCKDIYDTMQAKLANIRKHNRELDKIKISERRWVNDSEYFSESEVKNDDYINAEIPAIKSLVDKLLPFTVGNIRLNDRNIYGNNQSAILNSSWLSGIKHMTDTFYTGVDANGQPVLKNDELEAWGKRKLLDVSQNNASTLLIEQVDEKGNILNPGTALFRRVNDTIVLTENADKIFKIMQFSGSSNMNDGSNMSYANMVSGDFFPSSYMAFYTTKDSTIKGLDLATYFLKTPSDAPNAFTIRSIRHDATNLVIVDNIDEVNENINKLTNNTVSLIDSKDFIENYFNNVEVPEGKSNFVEINDDNLLDKIVNIKDELINNTYAIKKTSPVKEDKSYTGYVSYKTNSGIIIVHEGTFYKVGNTTHIKDAKLIGVANVNLDKKVKYNALPEEITNGLYDYYFKKLEKGNLVVGTEVYNAIKYKIDTNHNVFKMIRNQFKQEMLDAGIALSHYFNLIPNKNGNYQVELKEVKRGVYEPVFKDGVDITTGCNNYHIKNGKLLNIDHKKGKYNFSGAVFKTLNFTLNLKQNNKVKPKNYFEHLIDTNTNYDENSGTINFLYGGAMELVCDKFGKVIDVIFSDKQLANIDAAMSEYLMDYIDKVANLVYKNSKFIKNVSTNRKAIANYAANVLLMNYNTDYIFDSSPKFYKSPQDVIKRVKQYQGSGTPYGNANYSANFTPSLNESKNSFLNEGYIEKAEIEIVNTEKGKIRRIAKNEDGTPKMNRTYIRDIFDKYDILKGVRQRDGFTAVTIKNTRRTNVKALKVLEEILVNKCKLTSERAKELLYGDIVYNEDGTPKMKDGMPVREGGYQDTKVNDAQSYITIQEFCRRLSAKGHLKRYLPLIEKIMDETKEISANELSEFIQVQKNFYFDIWYDKRYGIERPRQIKNAEFVLIPRFIKGTQLEKVYEAMQKAGIDQLNTVETSKASNEKVLELWDNNGDLDQKTLDTFVSQATKYKELYSYNNLYTQQETPQHMDSENKAGIQIMKKMFDNIPNEGHPLSEYKKEFFRLYSKNIEEGYIKLLERLEIPVDEKGNIELDNDNTVKSLNKKVLYERMLEEARRTGVDDNQKDYYTIQEGSDEPAMVNYINNNLTKIESVFQSMFNSAVTRQKLPGFHAAQITNIGFKPFDENQVKVSYAKELRYHSDGKPFIEIMVPYKALGIDRNSAHYKGMTDEAILIEIQNKKLDEIIGYRIPTEGKQSIAIMKIVGFINDAQGSTIVVPDDWVSQTGSDFDIDSVYTITHEHKVSKNGEIIKVDYKSDNTKNSRTKEDWKNYVDSYKPNISQNSSKERKTKLESFRKRQDEIINKIKKEKDEAFKALSNKFKNAIKELDDTVTKLQQDKDLTKFDAFVERLEFIKDRLNKNKLTEKYEELSNYRNKIKELKDNLLNKDDDYYNYAAQDAGLLSLEEYLKAENDNIANTREARNSRILDIFLEILRNDASLEENLSRSNFDKISKAKKIKMDKNTTIERANRNPHNIVDQVSYQEETMSGRTLKGMSVALDTMCSVCNTVRPTLNESITIVYNGDEVSLDTASKSFNCKKTKNNSFKVVHDTYGWSKNNRNITGDLLTVYSSQTTAYILDMVKEGSIPNVNIYTFPVFKTLANIGSAYEVILPFITQPGITEIVNINNAKNSVFDKGYGNEINEAIKNIASKLPIDISINDSIITILATINKVYKKEINNLFKVDENDIVFGLKNSQLSSIPIIAKQLDDRLALDGDFKNNELNTILFDLGIVLIYSRLHKISGAISSIASCCNPDKFGAKQTVYSTRKLFDKIDDCIFETELKFVENENNILESKKVKKPKTPILSVNDKHILEAIYPGVGIIDATKDDIIASIIKNDDIQTSAYPPLFAFLKYATATSTVIAKFIFDTQQSTFTNIIENLGQTFSGTDKNVSEEVYNNFQKYLLATLYRNVPAIKCPVKVKKVGNNIEFENITESDVNNKVIAKEETSRIWGFNHDNGLNVFVESKDKKGKTRTELKPVVIKSLNNPTDDEIKLFEKLSPAQKVYFIQSNFSNGEIFNYLQVNLYNPKARGRWEGAQTIEFIDEKINPNELYRMFKRAFESDNPLVVSTAIDIIKYAVQVEGLRMSATAVNKIIDNDALINPFNQNGIGFVNSLKIQMRNFGTTKGDCGTAIDINKTYENYLRTLPTNVPIRTLKLTKYNKRKFNLYPISYGTYCLKQNNNNDNPIKNRQEFDKLLVKAGIKYDTISENEYGTNKYIYLSTPGKDTVLYKIHDLGNNILLTPLSKLEPNENSQWSAKDENNNVYLSAEAYEKLVNSYRLVSAEQDYTKQYVRSIVEKIKKEAKDKSNIVYVESSKLKERNANPSFNIEQLIKEDNGKAMILKQNIIDHFTGFKSGLLFVNNGLISENIFTPGQEYGSSQTITFPNGDKHNFLIFIPSNINTLQQLFVNPKQGQERLDPNETKNEYFVKIVEDTLKRNGTRLDNLAVVISTDETPTTFDIYSDENDEDEVYAATFEDKIVDTINLSSSINSKSSNNSSLFNITSQFKNNLFANDITSNVTSVRNDKLTSIRETASFVIKTANYIRTELFDNFIEDPENINLYIPITDSRIQDIIANNAFYLDKYLQAVNLAKDFLERVTPLTHEVSEDNQIQSYINDIKEALTKNLEDLPLDKLFHDAGNTLLRTKSTDPLIRQNFLDVFDGYWRTYGNMWQFHSIMENGTPILQTILSNVMIDLDAKNKAKIKITKEYRRKLQEILNRAAARGESIDINKLIDENGNFVAEYVIEFVNKLEEFRNEVSKHPLGSIKHLKAKLDYDKFKAEHVNQEAEDSYYISRNNIIENLLQNIPELYSEYMQLFYRRQSLYDYAAKEDLNDDQKRELLKINSKMFNLYKEGEYIDENGELKVREHVDPNRTYTAEERLNLRLYSEEAAATLSNALRELKELNDKIFQYSSVEGFNRTLNSNLALISRLEQRINGIPTVPQSVLNQNPAYVKAVNWIKNNAFFTLNVEYNSNNEPITLGARIMSALSKLHKSGKNTPKHPIFNDPEYRDIRGVIDGRKLTREQIEQIKKIDKYNTLPLGVDNEEDEPIDRILIGNRLPDNIIFNAAFYKRLAIAGNRNPEYYRIVTKLNELLAPLVGPIDGYIHFENIPDTEEGINLIKEISNLYNQLVQTRAIDVPLNGNEVSAFINNEVEFVTNTDLFNTQVSSIINNVNGFSEAFKNAMLGIFYIVDRNGDYAKDASGNFIPNRFLYSYAKPKGNPGERSYDQYINNEEREARALIDTYYETVTTEYYDYAKEEAINNNNYDNWYKENHYYNSYTRRMEPLSCWTTNRIKHEYFTNNTLEGIWVPKGKQATRRIRDGRVQITINGQTQTIENPNEDHRNRNYKPNVGHVANYKIGSGYDSGIVLNQSEQDMLHFLKDTLMATAHTNEAKRYFKKGQLPKQAKSKLPISKQIIKEIGKSVGIGLTENNGYSNFRKEIGYGFDENPTMPMLHNLDNKITIDYNKQLQDLQANSPVRNQNESDEVFANRVENYNNAIAELKEKIRKERSTLLDTNWYDVIENYISKAADYNAVLDNKNKLYFLLNVLKDMKMYSRKYGSYGELKKEKINEDGTAIYETSTDKNLIEQYENFLRRLFFNEWKESEGKLTTLGNFLQGYASANYMMLNVRGGFANVTLGETGILAEAAAKDYIGYKDWGFGTNEYRKGLMSYGASAYHYAATGKERAFSKQDAIIKKFNVVDYDDIKGIIRDTNLSHYAEQIRDALFSPQTMGEHFMQNSVLFAVLHSHKIFETEQGIMAMSKNEYINYKQYELLNQILNDDQRRDFEEFKNKLKENKDELAKYAWRRQEPLTKFIYINCNDEQIKEFKTKNKELKERLSREFDAKQNVYEQLELTEDGELGFIANSELARLEDRQANTLGNVTEAEVLLAKLSEKTRKINNKIHGVYNKKEAAHIESKWYGGLIMQYHKHIPMGLLKRYMARGHWNEFRHSVDKGMVQSIIDFSALNLEKVKKDCNFTDEETNALKSFVFQLTHCYKILAQMRNTWEIVPDYEKANIARNLGDLLGTVGALATTAALWAIADDDNPDGFWFNFFLYQSDRLSSEAFMYNPYGMINEGKKLMSTPIAAGSLITDGMNTIKGIVDWITDDEYDPYYHSGRFAGEHKLSVYIQRRIPIWNGIRNVIDTSENNHFYKVGENGISLFNIKENVRGK